MWIVHHLKFATYFVSRHISRQMQITPLSKQTETVKVRKSLMDDPLYICFPTVILPAAVVYPHIRWVHLDATPMSGLGVVVTHPSSHSFIWFGGFFTFDSPDEKREAALSEK